jgi:tRNA-splicing ligase RtcB (3'-phosphate/5'-hydroxy nucleic acid ligase)
MQLIDDIPVWGETIDEQALQQIQRCAKDASRAAMMADHHKVYSVPIGGVLAYEDLISPSGVGYDIGCGNKAVRLDLPASEVKPRVVQVMDDIWRNLEFGMGRSNAVSVDHELFDDDAWNLKPIKGLRDLARNQLGTIGSGNHYVDLFEDERDGIWIGAHFGSRGLGHKTASYFLKQGKANQGIDAEPLLLSVASDLGADYLECMRIAGEYAYAGRDWVCQRVASLLGAQIEEEIHNHHNFAWRETHEGQEFWVVRKGATPAFPGQKGFVGGSMGDISVILEGVESPESRIALYSTVHGAGRVMSRTAARGKVHRKTGRVVSEGAVTQKMMQDWIDRCGVVLRGAGTDESPHCYKRLPNVLAQHASSVKVLHTLNPIGVAMAGDDEGDLFRS